MTTLTALSAAMNNTFSPLAEWLGVSTAFVVYLSLAAAFITTVCIALFWLSSRKTRALKQKLERLQHDFRVSNNSAIGMGQKIMELEKQLKKTDMPSQFTPQASHHSTSPRSEEDSKYKPHSSSSDEKGVSVKRQKKSTAQLSVVPTNVPTNFSLDDVNGVDADEAEQDVAYELSKQLLDQGYSVEDIMNKSGLSFSEVSLMKSLSKR